MKRNYIFKEAGILLIAATLILSAVVTGANTDEKKETPDYAPLSMGTLLFEGFEGVGVPPGWLDVDFDGDTYSWDCDWIYPYSGAECAASASYINAPGPGPLNPDNWLITPAIDLNGETDIELSYWIAAQDPLYPSDHLEVWISTSGTTVPGDFTDQVDDYTEIDDIWKERTVDLSGYSDEIIYIAFRHCESYDWYWIKIDDVNVSSGGGGDPLIANAGGPYEAEEGEPIQFQGDASGGVPPYSFHWDFGNGDTSEEEDPIYTYDDPGVYQVILTVTDDAQTTDDDETTATINEKPCCFEVEILPGFGIGIRAEVTEICEENQAGVPWEFKITGGLIVIPISPLSGTADFTAGETKIIKAPLVLGIGSIAITFTIDDCEPREVNALIIGPFVIVR